MTEYENLLSIAKLAVQKAIKMLAEMTNNRDEFDFCDDLPREMKAEADRAVERVILNILRTTDVKILSEESGEWCITIADGKVTMQLRSEKFYYHYMTRMLKLLKAT